MRNYPDTVHSSFHTTFNVLENLRIATARGIVAAFAPPATSGTEVCLADPPNPWLSSRLVSSDGARNLCGGRRGATLCCTKPTSAAVRALPPLDGGLPSQVTGEFVRRGPECDDERQVVEKLKRRGGAVFLSGSRPARL
jgi:hypothetical protein